MTEPTGITDEEQREQMSLLHEHVRMIGDVLADDLEASEEQREQNREIGRKFAHLPD